MKNNADSDRKGPLGQQMLRRVRPLWLREKLYFHSDARTRWPFGLESISLEMAPVTLRHFSKSDLMHQQIAWLGFYELPLSRRIKELATDGGLLVDVGANIGYYSCMWAGLRADNKVYAFEPSPRVFRMLHSNIRAARLDSRVRAFASALGNENGKVQFDPGPKDQSGWGGVSKENGEGTINVESNRLDEILPEGLIIDTLKIDTEGADTEVLFGAERLLKERRVRRIFFEVNASRMRLLGFQPADAMNFLSKYDYKVTLFHGTAEFGEYMAEPA
jgi:FkbM family methyltransferase